MDESHAWPGPPARPPSPRPQGRGQYGTCAREAMGAPPGHVAAWLGASRSAEDGRRAGTRRLDGAGSMARLRRHTRPLPPRLAAAGDHPLPLDRPTCVFGSRRRNTVDQARRAKRRRTRPAASRRPPCHGSTPGARRAVLPALSRAAGGHRPMNLRPAGSWSSAPTISLPHCSWPFRAARERRARPGVTFIRSGGCSGHLTRPIVARAPRTLGAGDVTNIFPAFAGRNRPVL